MFPVFPKVMLMVAARVSLTTECSFRQDGNQNQMLDSPGFRNLAKKARFM